jgi:hypothetical protein
MAVTSGGHATEFNQDVKSLEYPLNATSGGAWLSATCPQYRMLSFVKNPQ